MTYQEIVAEIGHLSIEERLRLIEHLTRSVQADLAPPRRGSSLERLQGILKPEGSVPSGAGVRSKLNITGTSLERVLGMAKPDGPPPTDEEVDEMIANYLIEKHS